MVSAGRQCGRQCGVLIGREAQRLRGVGRSAEGTGERGLHRVRSQEAGTAIYSEGATAESVMLSGAMLARVCRQLRSTGEDDGGESDGGGGLAAG